MKPGIKVMSDYGCWPLWHHGGNKIGNLDPSTLGLSDTLLTGLAEWASAYDGHLNIEDPAANRWTKKEEDHFESEGIRLARLLASEVGDRFSICYSSRCIPVEMLNWEID